MSGGTGWEGDELVGTEDGREEMERYFAGEDSPPPRESNFDWPSSDAPAVFVECATRDEAATISVFAREQLVLWLSGGGLHPVAVCYRWVIACCFLRLDQPAAIERGMMNMHGKGLGLGKWERMVMEAIKPHDPWRKTLKRIDDNLAESAHGGRYHPPERIDGRSVAEVLEWVAAEAVPVPLDDPDFDAEAFEGDAIEIARASMRLLCRWCLQSGPGLLQVLQRFYALTFERYKFVCGGMTGEDLSDLVLQVRATFCEEMKRFFLEPGTVLLGYVPKTAGQKNAESSPVYAANAEANCPRRQLDGNAGLDRASRVHEGDAEAGGAASEKTEAQALADDWAAAENYVNYGGERFPLRNDRQREFAKQLADRLAQEFSEMMERGRAKQ